ncbi:hypothetical protein JHK82_029516 [Glycine max]|nr:hypothetical protein JHK86_029632 [Glycine max]KAG5128681.1 hypothetical protein JHK82_029516 [Glycine max]
MTSNIDSDPDFGQSGISPSKSGGSNGYSPPIIGYGVCKVLDSKHPDFKKDD